jgi:DNA-binding XRE family transcriptional regulator
MIISKEQCRAGRALLNWSRKELALIADIAERTLVDFERGARNPHTQTLTAIRVAMEENGILFIEENGGGVGVRFKLPVSQPGSSPS